jgi:hypothetical protein
MSYIMKPPTQEPGAPPTPYYAPFPGYPQPRRSSHRWVWMVLGIVALMSILGGALLAWGASRAFTAYYNSSLRAYDMYYTAIKDQDYSTAYSYLGSHLQTEYSQQTFTQAAQQQDEALGRVSSFGPAHNPFLPIPKGDLASFTVTVTRTNGITYTVHLELRQEGGAWKVTAFDRI